MKELNIGIAGIGGRPASFLKAIQNNRNASLKAVCDINNQALANFTYEGNSIDKYSDYDEMLQKAKLDLIIVGTPLFLHASQSIKALAENINVLSEVTAAANLEEAKALVQACKSSKAQYMMAENCNYMKPYMIVNEMVNDGFFGDLFYASGEYLHNALHLLNRTPWRRKLYFETGIFYGTHNLGPILEWFDWDRVMTVMCSGSGRHVKYEDEYVTTDDTVVMLAKTKSGRLIQIRTEFCSHPYALNYKLQGTKCIYDASLKTNGFDRIHTEGEEDIWDDINQYEKKYLPDIWRRHGETATSGGHGGSDFILITDVIENLYENKPMPIDIHKSMDMTLPGIISSQSVLNNSIWMDVPDSRSW